MSHLKHPWYKPRGYLHFDSPIGLKKSEKFATNPGYVAKHAFFPLISYNLNSVKIFKNSAGKVEKKCKSRPISYAAHMDSQIYSYYANILSEIYEEKLRSHDISDSVIAFRKLGNGKSNVDFANDAFEEIKRKKQCSAVALDISGFFDNLDHSILKIAWGEMLNESRIPNDHFNVYSSLTRYSSVEKEKLYKALSISKKNPKKGRFRVCSAKEFREIVRKSKLINTNKDTKGIPQGTPISALLSNIYMFKFDLKMTSIVKDIGGNYFRYCDDMLFIVPTDTRDVIEGIAIEEISNLKIEINKDKTEKRDFYLKGNTIHCNKPLQYLGFTFDGQRKLIRSAALAKFSGRMKTGIRMAKNSHNRNKRLETGTELQRSRLLKKKIYERYSHLGKRNFLTYGYRASKVMSSKEIRRQLKPLWSRLHEEIDKK